MQLAPAAAAAARAAVRVLTRPVSEAAVASGSSRTKRSHASTPPCSCPRSSPPRASSGVSRRSL
eukprot:3970288-Prymnesium_polylepis.1